MMQRRTVGIAEAENSKLAILVYLLADNLKKLNFIEEPIPSTDISSRVELIINLNI